MWLALRAILGRIGGWIIAGLSVLAWLKWRDHKARGEARAEAAQQQEIANATAIMDRSRTDDAVRRAGADAARDSLRRDFGHKPVRRVD